jgi:Putative porin
MYTKRRIATAVLTLATFIFAPTARPAADNGTDKKDADAPKADATTKPIATKENESSKDPNSAIEAELQQMRDLLNAQQQRIADLESELHASRTGTTSLAPAAANSEGATAVLAASANPGSAAPAAVPSPEPLPQDLGKRIENIEDRLKNIGPFSFSGDFRLRDEPWFGGPANESQDRNRERFRLRVNALVRLNDDLSGGFSLATGDINDPISTNQTANQYFTRKPFLLDKAFVNYNPHQFKAFSFTGGKMAYPWYSTELVWDKDLNPEGAAQKLEWKSEDWHVLRQFAIVGFEMPFSETAGVNFNYPNANNKSIHQSVVYGGQIQTAWQLASWLRFTADTAFYNWHLADPIALAVSQANSSTPADGLLKLNNTLTNSYQTVTVSYTVPTGTAAAPTGTTTVSSSIVNAQFNSKFALSDTIAQFDIKTHSDAWPIRFLGDYVQNTEACANANNPIFVPTEPTNANVKIATVNGNCNSNQRRGYWLESRFGRAQEKGDWQFAYTRIFSEQEAVISVFDFSDMRQGSNVTQHRVEAFYTPARNVQLGFTGLFGRPLNFGSSNPPENLLKRLQFDLIYKF